MSRTPKAKRAALSKSRTEQPLAAKAADTYYFGSGFGGNGHQGADNSRLRGMVYFPQLDTRREINSYSRTEMLRKARFLYANHGIAKRAINGLSRMVAGTGLTPQAATTDREWNAAAEKIFAQRAESPFVFDVGGRYDFYKSQQAVMRFKFRDGDCAAILTESASGGGRLAFYEGHQIGNALGMVGGTDDLNWNDGVRLDANNAAVGYRFTDRGNNYFEPPTVTDVNARDVIFFCDYERAGQSRGVTALGHAINNLLDSTEITAYIKTGVKLANQYGYWIETAAGSTPGSGTAGGRVGGAPVKVDAPTGDQVTLEKIYGAGQIPDLKAGQTLKFNGASHPHPNNLSLIEFLIRDIAWGLGVSPEILWNIAALGGANTRFVLADAQSWIEEQQQELVRIYCQRVWVYFIAKEMKAGRLPRCKDPEWFKCNWIPPSRLTVDFGRDGKLQLEQLKMGVITYSRLLGWQGVEFTHHTNTWLDELKFVKDGLASRGLEWSDLQQWRNVSAQPTPTGEEPTAATDDIPNDPAAANDALAALLKNPAKARAMLEKMRLEPEAA